MSSSPKAAFYTLGCKVNQYETAALENIFRQAGYQITGFNERAAVYVINTCTVTNLSDRKSRQAIRRAVRQNPAAVVAVVGCYAQVSPQEVDDILGVDIIIGTRNRADLPRLVEEVLQKAVKINLVEEKIREEEIFEDLPWPEETGRTRAFLKIQEGCEEYCSYCIVPYARGRQRSQNLEEVIKRVAEITAKGYRELVLTGTHLGAYGRDLVPSTNLVGFLATLKRNPHPERVRLSSLEPVAITAELIQAWVDCAFLCRHLHIPLQSGADDILQAMRRPYCQKEFRKIVSRLREVDTDMSISTDIITGFPGESEEHFRETLLFVEEMAFSRLHVFKYSPRERTPAAAFSHQLDPAVKEERSQILRKLGEKLSSTYAKKFIGRKMPVLLEKMAAGETMEGLTEHYLRVRLKAPSSLRGGIVSVLITNFSEGILWGEL